MCTFCFALKWFRRSYLDSKLLLKMFPLSSSFDLFWESQNSNLQGVLQHHVVDKGEVTSHSQPYMNGWPSSGSLQCCFESPHVSHLGHQGGLPQPGWPKNSQTYLPSNVLWSSKGIPKMKRILSCVQGIEYQIRINKNEKSTQFSAVFKGIPCGTVHCGVQYWWHPPLTWWPDSLTGADPVWVKLLL